MSFSIKDFTAQLNKSGGLAKTNRYFLEIALPTALATTYTSAPAVKEHFKYMVSGVSIPTKTISTNSVLAPGSEQKYPYAHEMEALTVTFLCTKDYLERKFIDDWMMEVVKPNGGSFTIGYRDDYSAKLTLSVFGDTLVGKEKTVELVDVIQFNACFPLSASAIELSYEEQSEVTTFEAVFQIDYWERLEMNSDLNIPNTSGENLLLQMQNDVSETQNRIRSTSMSRLANNNWGRKAFTKKPDDSWKSSPFSNSYEVPIPEQSRFARAKDTIRHGFNNIKKYI